MKKLFIILMVHCSRVALLALLLIPSAQDCFAQSITWQRTYQSAINAQDYGYEICPAPGGNFYFAGYSSGQPEYIYVLKINPFGDTIWSRSITGAGNYHRAYTCAMSHDSGFVLSGDWSDSAYSIKIDRAGNIIWQKTYGVGTVICWEIKKTSDNGFIACGYKGFNGYIFKIDSAGNLQWQNSYSGELEKTYYSIEEITGSGYYVTGYININSYDSSKAILDKIDYDGNLMWEKSYAVNKYNYGNKIKLINNNLLICGYHAATMSSLRNTFLIKTDQNGNLLNSVIFPNANNEFVDDIEFINLNRYILTLRQDSLVGFNYKMFAKIIIIDSVYNLIRYKVLPSYNYTALRSIIPLTNGDILFGGEFTYYSYWPERGYDFYAVRTDSLLNSIPLPPIGIKENSNNQPSNFKIHQNYPNPFNPITKITYEIPINSHVIIKVFNLLGQEMKKLVDENMKIGIHNVQFDGSLLSSGVYFYTLFAGDFKFTRKLVLIK